MRKITFAEGEYYHIYNRGTDKRDIFMDPEDYTRFFESIIEFNCLEPIGSIFENSFRKKEGKQLGSLASKSDEKLVKLIAYCLNPNHYHFLLQQVCKRGVERFMQRLGTGYTKYVNHKYHRMGGLFQGTFKAVHVESNAYLLHLSAYVNLNHQVHQLGSLASKSSWGEYVGKSSLKICDSADILGQFRNPKEYREFSENSLKGTLARRGLLDEAMLLE